MKKRAHGPRGQAATHRHHLALGGHEGSAAADPQLGLQSVEVDLQLALLLHLGRLVLPAIIPEVLQSFFCMACMVFSGVRSEARGSCANPFQKLLPQTHTHTKNHWQKHQHTDPQL